MQYLSDSPVSNSAINGFGRFALGLFSAWFRDRQSLHSIKYINDEILSIDNFIDILKYDKVVKYFNNLTIESSGEVISIYRTDGTVAHIKYSCGPIGEAEWLNDPFIVFECSGSTSNQKILKEFIRAPAQHALIGAITDLADRTLIMGFNHENYNPISDSIISFGSCTVVPGIHIISAFERWFGIRHCLVNIVHSVPAWQLEKGLWHSLSRKKCSLEKVAPELIPNFTPEKIKVNYTYAPYSGVSLMDFCFDLESKTSRDELIFLIESEYEFEFRRIIGVSDTDHGGEHYLSTQQSFVIIKESLDIRGSMVHFYGYFNNEGSGIRLHELANFVIPNSQRIFPDV